MMLKAQKVEYAKKLRAEVKKYKVVGVLPLGAIPDRLLQKIRNQIKPDAKLVIARKSLVLKALEGDERLERIKPFVEKNMALILTNKDPFELSRIISSNKLKLAAKPNQLSPEDISIESGETAIAPGQAVTDLKAAGIDVQIQKGKVVIAKSKVIVAKNAKISLAVAKALTMLDIKPFQVWASIQAVMSDNLFITGEVLNITPELVSTQMAQGFRVANTLTTDIGYVTEYNFAPLLKKGYLSALGLGLATKSYEPGIVEKLIAEAVLAAVGLSAKAPEGAVA
ncbi:MAG: 50S ribosomal protein L10 [Candidatus Micrarchaeota archaeon]|nr:50S ribosomal protein L10 [Candidatus Micrarchaeota archaeon]MDE1848082.1 50S ribosomal protein L10 [Candidatus Micrarchaeota archaeon]MDE1864941.1 50S ribosomal protein L10 [Candidatus Micrarchaeota archaeon]